MQFAGAIRIFSLSQNRKKKKKRHRERRKTATLLVQFKLRVTGLVMDNVKINNENMKIYSVNYCIYNYI